jgi:hypothetical protein
LVSWHNYISHIRLRVSPLFPTANQTQHENGL